MYNFVQKQSQTLNQFMLVHRNYYQNLYLNKTIPLNEKTLLGLPAFSAFEISQQFSKKNHFGVKIQTVSSRARNPKNQADINELKAINFFNKNKKEKEYFSNEGKYFQYATPLFIEQKCLSCHGAKEDAPKFISKKYDKAYDYVLGELRGIISIKVPKEKISSFFITSFIKNVIFDLAVLLILVVISLYLIKYFKNLALSLQNEVMYKTNEVSKNVAFLKSHQLAMDESSIVSKTDLEGNITYVNDNFCKITGYTKAELIGKSHALVRHPSNRDKVFKKIWDTIKAKKIWKGILENKGKINDYWVDMVILPILDDKQNIVEYIAVRHDVTQMVHQQQKLNTAANTDTLTGFGNRYKLNNDIRSSVNPALAILNIDNFSQINDFYGHEKGDILIKSLGNNIYDMLEGSGSVCKLYHLQGDEFVILNKDINRDDFIQNITSITSTIATKAIIISEDEIFLNLSAAISFEKPLEILITADMALKIARKENKSIVVYTDYLSLNDEYENNMKWTKKIKKAIETDSIIPVFQPIVNNNTGLWEKYECLVRLQDSDELISPYFFLNISKKTKYYKSITKIMLKKSFEEFKDKDIEFSVNLTIEDILNEDMQVYIFDMLQRCKNGSNVVFEIVESESIENFEQIAVFIEKVKKYGCRIAIDDFGTGYSNFEYLMKLKADYIKIDGSMIKNINHNKDAQMVVSMIVEFARKMDMKTIAEYVENESIQAKVKELGIDYSQGYYFSEPKLELPLK
ncbi:MAG: PAS domain S-box-containing protein/diguanylate cyclase (GGDEF)-like protein [Sulfurimonas sp.]|jgi:PAS domain S-box-containing protein/diguanylate cyclase (GGDEF)-like protein|uniref:EAL domain-containing protein n=1 Tax=Sulfurimonas sp. TaxID=2022749 RepID=UPI0039E3ED4F